MRDMSVREPVFVGLDNFSRLYRSRLFWLVMRNTLQFTLLTVIPSMVIGLGLAMLVNARRRGIGLYRTAFFYPVVMPMIAASAIWMFIFMTRNGLLDQTLISLGIPTRGILNNRNTALPALAGMYTWKEAGYLMIFFLSGLQNLDMELYEAARIDGAGRFTTFWRITVPLLMPTTLFVTIIALTNSVKLADHIIMMTEGAPNNATTTLLYYIYQFGFMFFDQGMASTLTTIMLVIMLSISLLQFFRADKKIHYN
jgi:sn-glycerol 3-phosphate transport system permease protein